MTDWKVQIREAMRASGHEIDEDIVEELSIHAANAFQEARSQGLDAHSAAERVGELIEQWKREGNLLRRRPKRPSLMEPVSTRGGIFAGLWHELSYGFRILRRQPGFTILTIVTMALGIAAAATLFSVTYSVLMKPLPYPEADRLVRLGESRKGATRLPPWTFTNASYLALREQPQTIEDLAAWTTRIMTVTGGGDAERIRIGVVTASTFSLMQARPVLGSVFGPDAERSDADTIVISYGLWLDRFGGSRDAVGQTLQLDGRRYVIAGVMDRSFAFPDRSTRAWMPHFIPPVVVGSTNQGRAVSTFSVLARLRKGSTPAQAAAEATARSHTAPDLGNAANAMFGTTAPADVVVVPAVDAITGDVRDPILVMLAAVALLLLTATANVASLQLARATARRRELAIRSAIGAGKGRLVRQLIVESVLLGVAGGIVGLLLSQALHSALPSLMPSDFPRLSEIVLGAPVLAFGLAISVLSGVAFGIVPAIQLSDIRLSASLAEDASTRVSGGGRSHRLRSVIMAGQVAIACVLLLGGGLLTRSFNAMMNADRGYDWNNLLTVQFAMPNPFTPERRLEVLNATLDRLRTLPGVTRAAFSDGMPMTGNETRTGFTMKSKQPPVGEEISVSAVRRVVSRDYFATLGIPIVEGRGFEATDTMAAKKVCIVNRMFARKYLTAHPIGDTVLNFIGDRLEYEVIGIIPEIYERGLNEQLQPEIYSVESQAAGGAFRTTSPTIVMQTTSDPRGFMDSLRSIVKEQDRAMSIDSLLTMEDRVARSLARPRFYAVLLDGFAAFVLVIAGVGLFGVLTYSVAQRSSEIAVRTALGARPNDIVRLVLRQALAITLSGVAIGLVGAAAGVRYLSAFLYGVTAYDTLTFITIPAVLALVAIVACVIPARRAAGIDPARVMRAG